MDQSLGVAPGGDWADDGPLMRLPILHRPPTLIWGALLADILRLGALSAGGLVGVMAFAITVKFLADGRVDLPGGLRLMTLAVVPMLQYALPFAGGFAATLAYHRFAADNEATAAMSCGVSHRAILAPALAAGLVTGVTLLALAHQVIPRFLRSMEEAITSDLTGVFVRTIERGESVRLGSWILHASGIVRAGPDPAVGAVERLRLKRALAVQIGANREAQGSLAADELDIWLFEDDTSDEPATLAQLVFRDYTAEGAVDYVRGQSGASQRLRIPSAFVDDPKFLTYSELIALRGHPERINRIDSLRRSLALSLARHDLLANLRDQLASEGRAVLERGHDERVVLWGGGLRPDGDRWIVMPPSQTGAGKGSGGRAIRIENRLPGGSTFVHEARSASISLDNPNDAPSPGARADESASRSSAPSSQATLILTALDIATSDDLAGTAPTVREKITLTSLSAPDASEADYFHLSVAELQGEARRTLDREDSLALRPALTAGYRKLRDRVDSLQREVTSKQHERLAYAIASVLTIVCGSIVALRRREALPLPVYLWSFFPALAAVITINAGQGLTRSAGPAGLLLLWGGVALLGAYTFLEFRRLRVH